MRSFYDLLQVDQHATLEEIKLAFKKRALHVHPDKGGSKEAFHLVYHAFETLADPEARRKYDVRAAKRNQATFCHGSAADRRQPFAARKSASTSSGTTYTARQLASALSQEAKLLVRIRDLLRSLPRDVRNDVIRQDFSQKQRLILEKWMVDVSDTPSAETQPVTEATATGPTGIRQIHLLLCQQVARSRGQRSPKRPVGRNQNGKHLLPKSGSAGRVVLSTKLPFLEPVFPTYPGFASTELSSALGVTATCRLLLNTW